VSQPLLSVDGVTVEVVPRGSREPRAVVRGASFQLERGECLCVVGESGSGKTVLLRSVLGISGARPGVVAGRASISPATQVGSAGSMLDLEFARPLRGRAGYVFQHPAESLDPLRSVGLQVEDSVRAAHPAMDGASVRAAVLAHLSSVQLPDPEGVSTLHPHELSGGMAQRVAIAVALSREPEILVADEPTTGLDWSVRREILDLLLSLCRGRGLALLLVSHDFQVVRYVASRVLVMYQGEIVEEGPRSRFFEPGPGGHEYTQRLQASAAALEADARGSQPSTQAGAARAEPLLEARGLLRCFPAPTRGEAPVLAVDGVDLEIAPSESVGLVGESGSGKTTLGRLLLRLLEPDAGTLRFEGRDLLSLPPRELRAVRSRMQMVHQAAFGSLNPGLTVDQQLRESIAVHRPDVRGSPGEAALLDETLRAFRLESRRDARPGELSGGERRRVGVARALLPRPRLVVADEPTAGLDASVKASVLDVMLAARRDDTAWLFVSHELDVVRYVADRVLVMYRGRVVQELRAADLRAGAPADSLHPYTERLLRSALPASPAAAHAAPGPALPGPQPSHPSGRPPADHRGCGFRERCHRVDPTDPLWRRCTDERPALVPLGGGRSVACHRFSAVPGDGP
jgi:ABC-type glutathione transport system ATPase component